METDASRDDLLRQLFAVPLDGFVEERNRLVRELRKAGDRETAAWLASLRRPTPVLWALNQLAERDPNALHSLLDLGAEMRGVQARAVRGDRDAAVRLREMGRPVKQATDDVVRRATEVLSEAGHAATTPTVLSLTSTLRAVLAAGAQAAAQLSAGTLLPPVEDPGFGFEPDAPVLTVLQGQANVEGPATERRDTDTDTAAADLTVATRRKAAAAAAEARRTAEAADEEVSQRQVEADRAQQALDELRARMRDLRQELSAAEDAAQAAALTLRDAVQRARTARRNADAADAKLTLD